MPEPLKRRLTLYEKAVELSRKGCSQRKIAKELGVAKRTVEVWLCGSRPKRVWRYEPDLTPSKDLAYVSGFYVGDGQSAGHEPKVRFNLADKDQLEYVNGLVARILGREPKPWKFDGQFYSVDYDSVALSGFLNWRISRMIGYLKGFERDFLQGFFDAEGYVTCNVNQESKRLNGVHVGVANTNREYLRAVRRLLGFKGLRCHFRMTNRQGQSMTIRGKTWVRRHDVFHVTITSSDMVQCFGDLVGFRNTTKAEKLSDLLFVLELKPVERYDWFVSHYRKEGGKWLKIREQG